MRLPKPKTIEIWFTNVYGAPVTITFKDVSIEYEDHWVILRQSNAETRINKYKVNQILIEGDDEEHMEMEDETEMEKELQESIRRAREAGVPEEEILKTVEDLDRYFTE